MIELKIIAKDSKELQKKIEDIFNQFCVVNEMEQELKIVVPNDIVLDKDFKLAHRDGKTWTEFEINFLTENYKAKSIKWIAGKLKRKPQGVYMMLNKLYKKGLPKKNNRTKNL